jgi:hypothetical protein
MDRIRRTAFFVPLAWSLATVPAVLSSTAHAATQGSGMIATEARTVPEFEAISTSDAIDLEVRQGAQQSLQVQADDNLLPLLETVVEAHNGVPTLNVRWKRGESIHNRSKVALTVVVPRLSALSASGSGDMRVESFTTPALQVALSGSGDARLQNLSTDDLGIRISGSGDVSGTGKAAKIKVSISGSGGVRLTALHADDVQVRIAGSGDAAFFADKTLDVRIAGSGDVTYSGNATVRSSVTGSGSVTRK